jgi:hypothetical protein
VTHFSNCRLTRVPRASRQRAHRCSTMALIRCVAHRRRDTRGAPCPDRSTIALTVREERRPEGPLQDRNETARWSASTWLTDWRANANRNEGRFQS